MKGWPVTVSYFNKDAKTDQPPVYAIKFELYENGISRALVLDYNDFAISGELALPLISEKASRAGEGSQLQMSRGSLRVVRTPDSSKLNARPRITARFPELFTQAVHCLLGLGRYGDRPNRPAPLRLRDRAMTSRCR